VTVTESSTAERIFCLHDTTLDAESRLAFFMLNKGQGFDRHITDIHIEKMAGGDLIYCPASTSADANLAFCGYNQLMDKSEIIEHLKVAHAIATLPPRKKRATKVHVDEDEQHVVRGEPGLADSKNPE
jgi:hypothetical protein